MFRQLVLSGFITADALVRLHPSELVALLELVWNNRIQRPPPLGHPDHRSDTAGLPDAVLGPILTPNLRTLVENLQTEGTKSLMWNHLIYAYMVENTRIYEVFRRVVHELLHGEKLGSPTSPTQLWLRNTEELFYRDPPPFSITTVSSHLRSDLRASRRNAYQRMFGMDLNHGTDENQPYPYVRAAAANSEFVTTLEELLREVWVGMIHVSATAAPRPTDDAKIATLAETLHDMLRSRRQHGNLSREEFVFVSMMSWFHLTVNSDLPIVVDLKAEAASAEQRLFKIAQRVGHPAHGLSKSYFDIADAISRILIEIEMGTYNNVAAVPALYTAAGTNAPEAAMRTVITHWATITGRDVKAGKVATT
jgi:hypothetical protein